VLCPYCQSSFVLSPVFVQTMADNAYKDGHEIRQRTIPLMLIFKAGYCPNCLEKVVALFHQKFQGADSSPQKVGVETFVEYVLPRKRNVKSLASEVPVQFKSDYDEAALVLSDSAKASAALSRRLLQRILREHHGIKKKDLFQEIDEYISAKNPPSGLADQLHAIRQVGKFAAHPIEDFAAGTIIDVEPQEAEWLLELVEALLDHTFVRPARDAVRMASLQAKLLAIKKTTPTSGP
jgi:Domain of unknown function (DUF4145)